MAVGAGGVLAEGSADEGEATLDLVALVATVGHRIRPRNCRHHQPVRGARRSAGERAGSAGTLGDSPGSWAIRLTCAHDGLTGAA